jgi:putative transposase
VRLSTERVLQEALEQEQTETLGRHRDERQPRQQGSRHGYEDGTVKTAAGGCRLPLPHVRGLREPSRATWWAARGRPREVLTRLSVERYAGGMAQRDMERAGEKALGQCVVSQRAVSDRTERRSHADEALRSRDLSGCASASLCIATVYEPRRRWGSTTGGLCVWGLGVEGRKVCLTLSPAPSDSSDSCREGLRDLVPRGLPTPVTMSTAGAPGLLPASEALWPRSLRMRCWFHTMQHRPQHVPPQAWPACKAWMADRRAAPTCEAGQRRQQARRAPYHDTCPAACRCLEAAAAASLPHLQVPVRHRQSVRTSNVAERAFAEERRRTKVIPHRWAEAS